MPKKRCFDLREQLALTNKHAFLAILKPYNIDKNFIQGFTIRKANK